MMVMEMPAKSKKKLVPLKVAKFQTGKGIQLGLSPQRVEEILGPPHRKENQNNVLTYHYLLEDEKNSSFLRGYKHSEYYGRYYFQGARLISFEFGFKYP
jgi:hypothetical protein